MINFANVFIFFEMVKDFVGRSHVILASLPSPRIKCVFSPCQKSHFPIS